MKIEILGMGCPKCKQLASNVEMVVKDLKIQAEIEKISSIEKIVEYGVMRTPAIAIDGKVVSAGRVLTKDEIKKFLVR
ncbi:MAG: thioredoxin family protein [Candidatus Omnitrophica bacterium]|nr:thioredoxin family protein [Candidatus Omnitrophota bacterium]